MTKPKERPIYQDDVERATEVLRQGGIILYPTDTVWGIGCDATQREAVRRIFELKRRVDAKSMLVLVDSLAMLESIIPQMPEIAYDLIEVATRPLTIVYDKAQGIAPNLLAEDGSLGVRMTQEAFSSALVKRLRAPIVSTSANVSGEPTPAVFAAISQEIRDGVDYIVGYRQQDQGKASPSQIIKLGSKGEIKIIRP